MDVDQKNCEEKPSTYIFRAVFSGLCAFVPDVNIDGEKAPSSFDVLLIETEHEDRSPKLHFKPHEEHRPVLRYELGDVFPDMKSEDREAHGLWTLEREELTLEVQKKNPEGKWVSWGGHSLAVKKENLSLLPRIDRILPDARNLDPKAQGDDPELVVARFIIDQGELEYHDIGHYNGENIVCQFVPPPPDGDAVIQELATKMRLTLQLNCDERIVIHSKAFGDDIKGEDVRSLVLNPCPPSGEIEIGISNLCCGYYMDYVAPVEELPARDTDFEFHFMLSDAFDDLTGDDGHVHLPIPVPVRYRTLPPEDEGDEGGGETIRCNLSLYNRY